jgi:tetratricopeptide (TPR) repeat protein
MERTVATERISSFMDERGAYAMTNEVLFDKIQRLEKDLATLKEGLDPATSRGRLLARVKKAHRLALENWTILSILGAIVVGIYVQLHFGVDYFESYRNTAETRRLSDFYCRLGDRLMTYSEWKAAEDAYRKALEINRNNIDATHGIVESQVFQPVGEDQYVAPEVVNARLKYLAKHFPDDHQVDYLQGIAYLLNNDNKKALTHLKRSIDKFEKAKQASRDADMDDGFVGAYIQLGYVSQAENQYREAIDYLELAVRYAPDHPIANNNLGYCSLLTGNHARAVECLLRAFTESGRALTALNLGDAYLYSNDPSAALQYQRIALAIVCDPKNEKDRIVGGTWAYNFLPLKEGDTETIRLRVFVDSIQKKRAFVHYQLSLAEAAAGHMEKADHELSTALKLDPDDGFRAYCNNKALYLERVVKLGTSTRDWLAKVDTRLRVSSNP